MAGKNDWRNHPRWILVILAPVLIFLITEEDPVMRGFLAVGILMWAVRYGRESEKWRADRSQAQSATQPPPQRTEGYL
ncbi:hypothetical protein ACFVX6_24070 [Streptomyces sp. NPDC058289]|uniref:hypothetical protein n=1 Tax=Streptomyces sp. NPDC058289 TaxID=3346425 RepID=UPI0036F09809